MTFVAGSLSNLLAVGKFRRGLLMEGKLIAADLDLIAWPKNHGGRGGGIVYESPVPAAAIRDIKQTLLEPATGVIAGERRHRSAPRYWFRCGRFEGSGLPPQGTAGLVHQSGLQDKLAEHRSFGLTFKCQRY